MYAVIDDDMGGCIFFRTKSVAVKYREYAKENGYDTFDWMSNWNKFKKKHKLIKKDFRLVCDFFEYVFLKQVKAGAILKIDIGSV